MAGLSSPEDILITELKEIHSAEKQLSRVLPRLAKKISSDSLKEMLEQRVEQGESLIEDIEDALEDMDAPKARAKNIAAEGLIEDTTNHLDEIEDERLIDPVLLASVQKIEHYCIASWGSTAALGRLLGNDRVVQIMEQVLGDGKQFDEEMTQLAEDEINPTMLSGEDGEEGGESGSQGKRKSGSLRKRRNR
jgi:ferritin-like metal-binding protein YciE